MCRYQRQSQSMGSNETLGRRLLLSQNSFVILLLAIKSIPAWSIRAHSKPCLDNQYKIRCSPKSPVIFWCRVLTILPFGRGNFFIQKALQYLVYDAVLFGLFGGHKEVAFHIFFNLRERATRVYRKHFVQPLPCLENVLCGNRNVSRLPLYAAERLGDHYLPVRQDESFAFLSRRENDGGA